MDVVNYDNKVRHVRLTPEPTLREAFAGMVRDARGLVRALLGLVALLVTATIVAAAWKLGWIVFHWAWS